ncbi:leucine-rich repeat domain-containing protein [uncultured Treponema sp.]|uniref:leucine-rich repeat domain-containing protein n=1 Tax=uncultured Treponema sp. TaxID=162155 RepID=UPI0025D829C8|nr:leucine-rich repeat domain-containing protein [uncultured Treponema sp.]
MAKNLSENPDFIIMKMKNPHAKESHITLRRYKGHDKVVTVPDGVEKISNLVFADDIEPNKTIEKIVIPDSVTEISPQAFAYCLSLKTIDFPKNLKVFSVEFKHCPSIEEIWIPESVEELGCIWNFEPLSKIHLGGNIIKVKLTDFPKPKKFNTFYGKKSINDVLFQNPAYSLMDGFMVNKNRRTVLYSMNTSKEMRVPEGMETLSEYAFHEIKLHPDEIPVEKVFLPKTVRTIKPTAFAFCKSLKEVVYDGFAEDLEVGIYAFMSCVNFHEDGSDIICIDRKPKKKTNDTSKLDRVIFIHRCLKTGKHYSKNELRAKIENELRTKVSTQAVKRDIDYMRDYFKAPIPEYDIYLEDGLAWDGFYYTDLDFELRF